LVACLRIGPGSGERRPIQHYFFDRGSYLSSARVWSYAADAGTQSGERDYLDHVGYGFTGEGTGGEHAMLDQQEHGTRGEIRVDRFSQDHWDAHRWRRDYEGKGGIVGMDDFRSSYEQLAVVSGADQLLKSALNLPTEPLRVQRIDPPVHKAEAVGRADESIAVHIKDRSLMDRDEIEAVGESLPGVGKLLINRGQYDFHNVSVAGWQERIKWGAVKL
jgi:hypothetical protein